MSQHLVLRLGGRSAVSGGLFILIGNIVHPREAGQLDNAGALLEVAAGSRLWVADHLVIMAGITVLLGAFFGVTHSISGEPGTMWARLAWGISIIGVGFGVSFMLTEAIAVASLSEAWASGSGVERDASLVAGTAMLELSLTLSTGAALFLFGATPVLVGRAILGSDNYPSTIGWAGVIVGAIGVAANLIQAVTGGSTQTGLVLVPVAIVFATIWIIYLGLVMWRRSQTVEGQVAVRV